MIGPGTGIAPFRAFLQERAANEVDGDSWLFFGAPNFTEDFLYQTELQDYFKKGQLKRLDLAFSRDQDYKIYVQDRLRERSEELWRWIERGAHIYVCGDATRMAKDVQDALLAIFEEQGQLSSSRRANFSTVETRKALPKRCLLMSEAKKLSPNEGIKSRSHFLRGTILDGLADA